MFTTFFWLSLNSLNLPEGRDIFQMIQKHPTLQSGKFKDNHGTFKKSGMFPVNLKSFQTIWSFQTLWKVYRQSGNFPDNLETFQTIWKLSWQSWDFPDNLKTFPTIWELPRQYEKFTDNLKSLQTTRKLSWQVENFPDFPL